MTEKQYSRELDSLINQRDVLITSHFGIHFLQKYMDAGEREWYKANIGNIDNKILDLANKISIALNFNVFYKKLAEVFKDEHISAWYNKHKIEKIKEHQKNEK